MTDFTKNAGAATRQKKGRTRQNAAVNTQSNNTKNTVTPDHFSLASRWVDAMDSGDTKAAWTNVIRMVSATLQADNEVGHG